MKKAGCMTFLLSMSCAAFCLISSVEAADYQPWGDASHKKALIQSQNHVRGNRRNSKQTARTHKKRTSRRTTIAVVAGPNIETVYPVSAKDALRIASERHMQKKMELEKAIHNGDAQKVLQLISSGTLPDTENTNGVIAVIRSASLENRLDEAMKSAARLQEKKNFDLRQAATAGHRDSLLRSLAVGAQVDAKDTDGMTPLMLATTQGKKETVRDLLEAEADPNLTDVYGMTALILASREGNQEIVNSLLAGGADPNIKANEEIKPFKKRGASALMGACMAGDIETVQLLLDKGARADQQDDEKQTALMYAVRGGFANIVTLLCSHGEIDPNKRDMFGRTALTLATLYDYPEIAKILIQSGADINIKDMNNLTPMSYAIAYNYSDMRRVLENFGK